MRAFKKIAMIYREVGTCGGIQRGASFQVEQFRSWGYDPIVLTEKDLGSDAGRKDRLAAILRERQVDLVIEHDAYVEEKLTADIFAAKSAGVPVVVFWHSVFSWMVAEGVSRARQIFSLLRQADAVIALSATDETFFRMIGCRALSIPYCDADIMEGFERKRHPHRVLWMGRLVGLKRPLDAIRVVERLRQHVSDAELVMLGDAKKAVLADVKRYLDLRPGLREAVRLEGFQKDVRPFLESAGAGLVTSKFEGFCHAIVEMKMASLPVVSYAMPYLETLAEGTGAFQVPQGDVEAAATRLADLFADAEECGRQGVLARRSYEAIRSFDQRGAYERLFADLPVPASKSMLTAPDPRYAKSVIDTLLDHGAMWADASARRCSESILGCPGKSGLRGALGRFLIGAGRTLCRRK